MIKEIKDCRELFKTNWGEWVRPLMLFLNDGMGSREHGIGLVVKVDDSEGWEREIAFREGSAGIRVWTCWGGEGIDEGSSYVTYLRGDNEFTGYDIKLLEAEVK